MRWRWPWAVALNTALSTAALGLGCSVPDRTLDPTYSDLLPGDADTKDSSLESETSSDSASSAEADAPEAPSPPQCDADTQTDPNHCGSCENVCHYDNAQAQCVEGHCQMGTCQNGYRDCVNGPLDGCDTYVMGGDIQNCGGCGLTCTYDNALASCNNGSCEMGRCQGTFRDCKNGDSDGCESNIQSDPDHCSGCNKPCAFSEGCCTARCCHTEPVCGAGCEATCAITGRWSVTDTVAVDYQHGKRLWQRANNPNANYNVARLNCQNLNLGGMTGWRLPSRAELNDLRVKCGGLQGCAEGYCCPCIDQAAFLNTVQGYYWSGDTQGSGSTWRTYVFDTASGRIFPSDGTDSFPSKCTHDPL